jgi:hypothetical protein
MKRTLANIWHETDGSLSFEWTMVLTLLVIGIVSGLAAARDAIIDELGDVAQAAGAIDQSYNVAAINIVDPPITAPAQVFTDDAMIYTDCARQAAPGQGVLTDSDS